MVSNDYKKVDSDKYRRGQSILFAIIGILASIVLVSLGSARGKAREARIKADISQVAPMAYMIDDDKNSFASLCDSDNTLNQNQNDYGAQLATIENDIRLQQGSSFILKCYSSRDSFCVETEIYTGFYCIDSNMYTGESSDSKCNNKNLSCE